MSVLKKVNNAGYKTSIDIGAGRLKQICWYFVNVFFLKNSINTSSGVKIFFLKLFGSSIGEGVVIKPSVNIKYPWKLVVGNYSWIGEAVWIDNLEPVEIGNNCCLSQGCLLLTGSHDAMKENFDYTSSGIQLKDGVWIGANAVVSPGVVCGSHSVLGAGSVTDRHLEPYTIYKGNPAVPILKRIIL
jgi:putative colanic acid biosynthesis acetyltransferase WcaF